MRKYLSYILCTLAAVVMTGCLELGVEIVEVPAVAKLQLKSTELVATRTPGVPGLNENRIKQVQLYFTADGENVLYYTKEELNDTDGVVEDLPVVLPAGAMEELFTNTSTCKLFVVANAQDIVKETIKEVKATAIALAQKTTAQDSLVMIGLSENITKNAEDNSVGGSVDLKRVVAKVEVILNIDKSITLGDSEETQSTWESAITAGENSISMLFSGMTASTVEGTKSSTPFEFVQTSFNTSESTDDLWVVKQTVPFYSYPTTWTHENENEIILTIPWKRSGEEEYKTYTYQIPVNYEQMKLESNYLYQLTVNVGILGGLSGDVTITPCSYVVIDWGTGTINTELSRPKYLVVDENNVVMNNVNSYSVGYASSDAVSAVITKITKPDYSGTSAATVSIYSNETGAATVTPGSSISGNKNPFTISVNATDNQISLSHTLVNDNTSDSFDFVPYDITVKVTNQSGFTEFITIRQYPAVYVENHLNNNGVKETGTAVSGDSDGYNGHGYGYVMVNTLYANRQDYNSNGSTIQQWQTVESFDETSYNPNMYIITTTALDASLADKYILGDSREVNTYTAKEVGFTSITDTRNRTLEQYRPTKTDRSDYLSPKFRISSAYGQLGSNVLDRTEAKLRCAAYQEDGYPAGRWRLATYAELEFIAMLCANDALPVSLFGASDYWCATGALNIDTDDGKVSSTPSDTGYLRCVYDDWYWGNEQLKDKSKYVWGEVSTTAEINVTL